MTVTDPGTDLLPGRSSVASVATARVRVSPTPPVVLPVHERRQHCTAVHRLPAALKLVTALAFVLVVVATPAGAWPAFGLYAILVLGTAVAARVPAASAARRSLVEVPFLVFAAVMPFVTAGPTATVAGLTLSIPGLIAGGTLAAKATLGVFAAIVLSTTTTGPELVAGLERLRLPTTLVAVIGFMIRYASVLVDDVTRMRAARQARGASGHGLAMLAAVAGGVGSLFVRTYERGERVARAMSARGYTGTMPQLGNPVSATPGQLLAAAAIPATALVICVSAWSGWLGAVG